MFTNRLNITFPVQTRIKKTVHEEKTHAEVSKKGHADSLLGYERIHYLLISLKKVQLWAVFPLANSMTKFTLFIEWPLYIYIYIYIYMEVSNGNKSERMKKIGKNK